MNTTVPPSTDDSSKEDHPEQYLFNCTKDGKMYFKSKFIVDDVDLSSKEIGAPMVKLRDSVADPSIEKWSHASATTWRVGTT